ncbi:hypothetical protein NpNSSI1_00011534 [Neofusicoccum parvum]|nr:hypothetical protein NpNSSI1_00011534 [Neofusicoccum parvum]
MGTQPSTGRSPGIVTIIAKDPKFEWKETLQNGIHTNKPAGGYENVPRLLTVGFGDNSAPARREKMMAQEPFVVSVPTSQDKTATATLKYKAGLLSARTSDDVFTVVGVHREQHPGHASAGGRWRC